MSKLEKVVSDSFSRYAGNVILDRAICDVRDMLKPSARMLLYSQLTITKNTPDKKFIKAARVVGDVLGHYYTHGDGACYATYMRMAKPFAMRYPLEDCQGNYGTITETGDEAHMRYTELRLSKLGMNLFQNIKKNTIDNWFDNFDETEKYPRLLTSMGFYNIVNGSTGIGVSLSSSIPQFNIKDINKALCELIKDINYEVDILPDFATGGILINADEVKESLKYGKGKACKIRSVVEYNDKERTFTVKEIPYGVYTNTISKEIQALVESNPNCGIDHINDGSGKTPDYVIYLTKTANPDKVLKLLYKETSLESHFTINMTTLVDNGSKPKVLGLKEMLLAHIDHERIIYRKGYEFDLNKYQKRLHIITGLMICLDHIEEVISIIKSSSSTQTAAVALKSEFKLDDEQVKAILDMKLSRLAHLEVDKLENERKDLLEKVEHLNELLTNQELLDNEVIKGLEKVAKEFGDERRTKILNLSTNEEDEVIEDIQLSISFTNKGTIYTEQTSSLYAQRRNGKGTKFKLDKNEYIIGNFIGSTKDIALFFTENGNFYPIKMSEFICGEKQYITSFINAVNDIKLVNATSISNAINIPYIIFITKNGIIKKSNLTDYNLKKSTGAAAIKLDENDSICSVLFAKNEPIGILTKLGNFVILNSENVKSIGRVTRGITGIKLDSNDEVVSGQLVTSFDKNLITITSEGLCKKTSLKEFKITNRNTKGVKAHKSDNLADFIISNSEELLVTTTASQIRIRQNEIPLLNRTAAGVSVIKMSKNSKIIKISEL